MDQGIKSFEEKEVRFCDECVFPARYLVQSENPKFKPAAYCNHHLTEAFNLYVNNPIRRKFIIMRLPDKEKD